jgi:hypothetical protein
MGVVVGDDQRLELQGEQLGRYVQLCADQKRTVDVLLKLDDVEEDSWGTMMPLASDDFGDDHDLNSRRPLLDLEVEIERPGSVTEEAFLLESGMGQTFPLQEHRGEEVLLFAEVVPQAGRIPPGVFVRGGLAGEQAENSRWEPLQNPIVKRWDWSQIMVMTPARRVTVGETLQVEIAAPFVAPGPRELQTPELVLVAPTGKVHRLRGKAVASLRYSMEFQPDEPGVWRYGWAFRPTLTARSEYHAGEGVFYADLLPIPFAAPELKKQAEDLVSVFKEHKQQDRSDVLRMNSFVRLAASFSRRGPAEEQLAKKLIEEVRGALPRTPEGDRFEPRGVAGQ